MILKMTIFKKDFLDWMKWSQRLFKSKLRRALKRCSRSDNPLLLKNMMIKGVLTMKTSKWLVIHQDHKFISKHLIKVINLSDSSNISNTIVATINHPNLIMEAISSYSLWWDNKQGRMNNIGIFKWITISQMSQQY